MKKYKINNNNKIIIIAGCLVFILIILLMLLNIVEKEISQKPINVLGVFDTVEEVIEYYDCKYIRESKSKTDGFSIDIMLVFKEPLYTNDESNEKFFNDIIYGVARVLNYRSFILIDSQNNIEIKVTNANNKIQTITINEIEDYFTYMDSQIGLKNYKKIKETEIVINSPELITAINNNWKGDISFGTREKIVNNYYIYFEGIETRRIDSKIYNIVFTEKYVDAVANGLIVGMDFEIIKNKLGTPSFESSDKKVIGYKCSDIYIFFGKDYISVYRKEKCNYREFLELVDEFLNDEKDLLDFMNDLTYLWPDYSEYTYSDTYFFISYPLKGVDIKFNYENTNGIIIYNNFEMEQSTISNYLEHTEFISKLQVDNVFEAEMRRINN